MKKIITKSLVDRISEAVKPQKENEYYFQVLRLTRSKVSYIGIVHGNFEELMKPYDGWGLVNKIKYSGPEEWAEDLFISISSELEAFQSNTLSSPVPIYPLPHQGYIEELVREKVTEFNMSFIRNNYNYEAD